MSNSDEGFGDHESTGMQSGSNSVTFGQYVSDALKDNEFDAINVIVRVRPTVVGHRPVVGPDKTRDPSSLFPAAGQIQISDPMSGQSRSFTFNVVFEPEATQEEVFEHSGIKRLINMALEGFACTVFAYGQTSSGKTHTLTGNVFQDMEKEVNHIKDNKKKEKEKKVVGIIQYAFAYLFEQIKLRRQRGVYYVVTASYLEVYNEQVLDLLNPSRKSLNVRWSKDRGFYAENLFKVECEDILDLEGVLEEGCKNRQVRSHEMNETSSRSHSLLTVVLASETQDPEDPQGYIRREGRLCLVDLAGSEKTKRTQSKGDTLVEANNINRSLLVLGNCISALSSNKRRCGHIPYRDSTLTKLLADSLSGSGMTLMIACVSPLPQDGSETINTLRYAMRAKNVKTNPIVRMDPRELLILSLKREVRLLRMENNYLRQQLNLGSGMIMSPAGQQLNNYSNSSSPAEGAERKIKADTEEVTLKDDLLRKYMQENEGLRSENAQMHIQRERLIHDHEMVCRENEKLLKRLNKELIDLEDTQLDMKDHPDQNLSLAEQLVQEAKADTVNSSPRTKDLVARPRDIDTRRPSIVLGLVADDNPPEPAKSDQTKSSRLPLKKTTREKSPTKVGDKGIKDIGMGLELKGTTAATKTRYTRK